MPAKRPSSKRTTIEPRGDKRFIRRDEGGRIKNRMMQAGHSPRIGGRGPRPLPSPDRVIAEIRRSGSNGGVPIALRQSEVRSP